MAHKRHKVGQENQRVTLSTKNLPVSASLTSPGSVTSTGKAQIRLRSDPVQTQPPQNKPKLKSRPFANTRPLSNSVAPSRRAETLLASWPRYILSTPLPSSSNHPTHLLHLTYPTAKLQHLALARISAYSESRTHYGQFLSLRELGNGAGVEQAILGLCKGYIGFNVSVDKVAGWLGRMWEIEIETDTSSISCESPPLEHGHGGLKTEAKWWVEYCTAEEARLVELLEEVGLLRLRLSRQGGAEEHKEVLRWERGVDAVAMAQDSDCPVKVLAPKPARPGQAKPQHQRGVDSTTSHNQGSNPKSILMTTPNPSPYIISNLHSPFTSPFHTSQQTTTHELAHFTYHSLPRYRHFVNGLWNNDTFSSARTRECIQTLLVDRLGYAGEVCVDEWQAYLVAEGVGWLVETFGGGRGGKELGSGGKRGVTGAAGVGDVVRGVRTDLERCRRELRREWEGLWGS